MTYQKTFGITKVNDKFAVCTDIKTETDRFGKSFTYKTVHHNLIYKKANFALKQAENFVKSCHKPFTNFQNEKVEFQFVNMGIIN